MDWITDALVAFLGGASVWALTSLVRFFRERAKLRAYLVMSLQAHLRGYQEAREWLVKTCEHLQQGQPVERVARYTRDELADLTEVRQLMFPLLPIGEVRRVTKAMRRMHEVEVLMEGFCASLHELKESGKALEAEDLTYLAAKMNRLLSYFERLPHRIEALSQLPLDYAEVIPAADLVPDREDSTS